ncbi:glutamine--fructose-6-phosphate transaminase (isomerizing), partial [Patescibacteria group bacterium]
MCGIIGYTGKRDALPIILSALKKMEYRGYDSSGISIISSDKKISTIKSVGKIANLEEKLNGFNLKGTTACGHQRWATHGEVTEENSHPHTDCFEKITVVHNGIIENYKELKDELISNGHKFKSETDTEVLAHLIEDAKAKNQKGGIEESVSKALKRIQGAYGIIVLCEDEPEKIVAARMFSPLLLGIGEKENLAASDSTAITAYAKKIIYLDDGELAVLTPDHLNVFDLGRNKKEKAMHDLEIHAEDISKKGFETFMIKEINEQPEAIINSTRGRLTPEEGKTVLGGLREMSREIASAKRIIITACGTAYFAGCVGEYMLEEYAGIPVEVDLASEFRYRKPVFQKGDILIAISQSGETADTIAAIREAKEKRIPAFGIVNAVGSTIARDTDAGVYQHVGPEIGVASTKA